MESVSVSISSPLPPAEARSKVVDGLASTLRAGGYRIESQSPDQIDFIRFWRSPRVWFFTIITFPVGLIFFLAFKQTARLTVLLQPDTAGTLITISGEAPSKKAALALQTLQTS